VRLKPQRRFCQLGELAAEVGWKHQTLVARLEARRKVSFFFFWWGCIRQRTETLLVLINVFILAGEERGVLCSEEGAAEAEGTGNGRGGPFVCLGCACCCGLLIHISWHIVNLA
jgi:hypothetical protein